MRRNLAAVIAAAVAACAAGPRAAPAGLIVPHYHSLPGATAKLFLDFDGDVSETFGPYFPGTTPAYTADSDATDFSAAELENIRRIWAGVAEKYSPFNLDVTTEDPGNRTNGVTMAVIIGGNGGWAPAGSGGIAALGGFTSMLPNQGFVFPANLSNNPGYIIESAAHEAAHGLGLRHQSRYGADGVKIQEYNTGDSERAPIMGTSYYARRGQWWFGPSTLDPSIKQDDLRVLTGFGTQRPNIGYRADDHGSTLEAAEPLAVSPDFTIDGRGIIEQSTDADYFSFTTPGGVASFFADVNPEAPMLDLSLSLYDAAGNLLASRATSSLGEHLSWQLAPGGYTLAVSGAGGYGDLGQYTLGGTVVPEPSGLAVGAAAVLLLSGRRNRL